MNACRYLTAAAAVVLVSLAVCGGVQAQPATTAPDGGPDAVLKDQMQQARQAADKVETGEEGLAIWQAFVKKADSDPASKADPLVAQARTEVTLWQDRATKKLNRFGPEWLPRDQVARRKAQADELVAKAESAGTVDAAVVLLNQAAAANPYRADIPFRKAVKFYKAKRGKDALTAWSEVLRSEPNNVPALNDLSVLAAVQKNWATAIARGGKTLSAGGDNEKLWDNFDQIIATASAAGYSETTLMAALKMYDTAVRALQKTGRHLGEVRWGTSWVSTEEYQRYMKENADIDRAINTNLATLASMKGAYAEAQQAIADWQAYLAHPTGDLNASHRSADGRGMDVSSDWGGADAKRRNAENAAKIIKQIEEMVPKLRKANEEMAAKRNIPPRTGKLYVLEADGSQLDALEIAKPTGPGENKDNK